MSLGADLPDLPAHLFRFEPRPAQRERVVAESGRWNLVLSRSHARGFAEIDAEGERDPAESGSVAFVAERELVPHSWRQHRQALLDELEPIDAAKRSTVKERSR